MDSVLRAVEETAWSARGLADSAGEAWGRGERGLREAHEEVVDWSEQLSRAAQTGWVLTRIAADYRLYRLRAAFVSRPRAEAILGKLHEDNAARFHDACASHGGAFMKVGQLLSARSDLLPAVWVKELTKLQDCAPNLPFEVVRAVVEKDLGRPLEELFASFDERPVGAASIGQVHRAVTMDGAHVAVKVQRPGIHARVRMDLELLETFVSSLTESLPEADYETIVSEVRRAVLAELDYSMEAKRTREVADFFEGHAAITVPHPVDALCSERVLTTRFVEGRKLAAALEDLERRKVQGDEAARREQAAILGSLLEAYLRQVLEAGVFQADPHPGNFLVDGDGRVAILDFGCAEALSPEVRRRYLELVCAFVFGQRDRTVKLLGELGFATRSGRPDTLLRFADALLSEIRQATLSGSVRWPTREEFQSRAAELFRACEDDPVIKIPAEFVMIGRVFGTLGGQFARYRPEVDFARHILPILMPVILTEGE